MKRVYFDSAATTKIHPEVIECMTQVMQNEYGNASSTHSYGRSAKAIIESTRKSIAKELNVSPSEIIFTSGGTEADNLALRCAVKDLSVTHIVTSKIEHHAVTHTVEDLEQSCNVKVSYVNINSDSTLDYNHLEELLKTNQKTLVSLMHVNNEVGTILDIKRVYNLCKAHNALLHSDTVQSVGHFKWNLKEIPVDFLAVSAHKFHGPKGVGFVYIKKEHAIQPMISGGQQERGCRAGTESVHNIAGLEKAFNLAYQNLDVEREYIVDLKKYFIDTIKTAIPNVVFNGLSDDLEKSTYTLVNVRLPLPPEKAAMLLFQLDLKGISCSKGSACQSGSGKGSHVLAAFLTEDEQKQPSLRFSFSKYNTKNDIDYVIGVLKGL